jgi:hypothetical protein
VSGDALALAAGAGPAVSRREPTSRRNLPRNAERSRAMARLPRSGHQPRTTG